MVATAITMGADSSSILTTTISDPADLQLLADSMETTILEAAMEVAVATVGAHVLYAVPLVTKPGIALRHNK